MSEIKVDSIGPRVDSGTLTIGASGDTVSIPSGATLANAGTVTGLPASAISSGTMATARLGSGTASSSTFLRGDQTYAAVDSTIETPYAARMYKSANQTIGNAAWTLLDLNEEVYDKGSIADLSTSKITVPSGKAGFWVFNFFIRVNNFRADRNILQLYKNGSATSGTSAGDNFENGFWGATSQYSSLFGHLILNLAAADYIQPYFYQNSGGSETIFERSFSGWYLGASS